MIEIADGAKRNFSFNVVGTARIGGMDGARTKTQINGVAGSAKMCASVSLRLPKSLLRFGMPLQLIERNANNTDGAG